MKPLSFNFIKENCQTIAQLKERCDERRLLQEKGFRLEKDRVGNISNTQQVDTSENTQTTSLIPSLNYTKLNQARTNLHWQQAMKELNLMEV